MTRASLALVIATLAVTATAQTIEIPCAGFVYNPATAALHPISGLLGAAVFGSPVLSGITAASASADGDAAIIANAGGVFAVTGLRSATPQWQPLGDPAPFFTAWSRNSGIAFSPVAGFSQFTRTAAGTWTVAPLAPGLPPGTIAAIDYDESARALYVSLASGDGNAGVWAFSLADSTLRRMVPLAQPAALTHANGNLYILDAGGSVVWSVPISGDGAQAARLPIDVADGSRFIAIAASLDGARLYLADSGLSQIAVYDPTGQPIAQLPVPAAPSKLERLGGGSVLLLGNEANQPAWLLNDTATPVVFFVPALNASQSGGSN